MENQRFFYVDNETEEIWFIEEEYNNFKNGIKSERRKFSFKEFRELVRNNLQRNGGRNGR